MLSLAGKEVLLKSIAMALPVYAMSCFRLTKHHCQKIMSAMSAFWWNESSDKKKIHWIPWDKLCESKENGGLGFRDIEDFNQALLAKQAWRLLNDPSSLLARVFKGRYYAKTNFLEAGKGYRPSYAWRSILFGRELLMQGLVKSIGKGSTTLVWQDKWIFDECPRRAVNKQIFMNFNLKVSELFDSSGKWNMELLSELFPVNEIKRILALDIGGEEDKFIWTHTRHGSYTVKSGYWLVANKEARRTRPQSPLELQRLDLKKKVWKIATLPKIKMFFWRVLSGAVAVADRLNSRGLNVPITCQICNSGIENINHVLFQCPAALALWVLGGIKLPTTGFSGTIEENISFLMQLMETTTNASIGIKAIPWLLWTIWKNRNAIIYAATQESPSRLVQLALDEALLWWELNKKQGEEERQRRTTKQLESWSPPALGTIKCNIHANWRNAVLHSGVAWIARDSVGQVQFHAREAFTCSASRLVAELRCVIWVLQSVRDLHFQNICIAADHSDTIAAISNPNQWPRYRYLLEEIKHLCLSFAMVSFEDESVCSNSIARDIAKSVLKDGRFQSYLSMGGPAWLHERIYAEAVRNV